MPILDLASRGARTAPLRSFAGPLYELCRAFGEDISERARILGTARGGAANPDA